MGRSREDPVQTRMARFSVCLELLLTLRDCSHPCPGTSLIASFLEMFMAFLPPRFLQRLFPPLVTGTVILMIGASLVGSSGIPDWGGGSNDCMDRPATGFFALCPDISAPRPLPYAYLPYPKSPRTKADSLRFSPDGDLQSSSASASFRLCPSFSPSSLVRRS